MIIIRTILIILFFIVLANKPTYVGFRGDFTNWEWHLGRMPLWRAIVSYNYCLHDDNIEVEFAKIKYVKGDN